MDGGRGEREKFGGKGGREGERERERERKREREREREREGERERERERERDGLEWLREGATNEDRNEQRRDPGAYM